MAVVMKLPLVQTLSEEQKLLVVDSLTPVAFEKGALIVAKGQPSCDLTVVADGEARRGADL